MKREEVRWSEILLGSKLMTLFWIGGYQISYHPKENTPGTIKDRGQGTLLPCWIVFWSKTPSFSWEWICLPKSWRLEDLTTNLSCSSWGKNRTLVLFPFGSVLYGPLIVTSGRLLLKLGLLWSWALHSTYGKKNCVEPRGNLRNGKKLLKLQPPKK